MRWPRPTLLPPWPSTSGPVACSHPQDASNIGPRGRVYEGHTISICPGQAHSARPCAPRDCDNGNVDVGTPGTVIDQPPRASRHLLPGRGIPLVYVYAVVKTSRSCPYRYIMPQNPFWSFAIRERGAIAIFHGMLNGQPLGERICDTA